MHYDINNMMEIPKYIYCMLLQHGIYSLSLFKCVFCYCYDYYSSCLCTLFPLLFLPSPSVIVIVIFICSLVYCMSNSYTFIRYNKQCIVY